MKNFMKLLLLLTLSVGIITLSAVPYSSEGENLPTCGPGKPEPPPPPPDTLPTPPPDSI